MKKMFHPFAVKVCCTLALIASSFSLFAQTGVKIAGTAGTAHSSAMLDVESTSKGVLVPRMTAAQRGAISGPAEGLLVYQTDAPAGYWYFNGSVWIQMGVGAISGAGTTNYVPKWSTANSLGNSTLYDNGNVGIGTTGPAEKLHVNGGIRAENGIYNSGGDHMEFMSGVRSDDNSYEWIGFYSGGTRQGIFLWDGQWSGANSVSNEFSLTAENSNLLTLNTTGNHVAIMPKGGNVGIGTLSPSARLHMTGGGQIIGTPSSGTNSNLRTLTILQDGQGQINFGSYDGAWTSALQIQSNDNARYLWLSPLTNGGNARLVSVGSDFSIYASNTATPVTTFTTGGNVGIGTTSPGFRLHVPSGYIGTDYINTSDNVVTSGVTGIMVKAGDNYHRTATAAAIQAFIGSTGADNLGNHTATTYLQMGSQWINFSGGNGLYSSNLGNYFYIADASYWYMRSNAGMQLYNNGGTRLGYLYHDNSASCGLLPSSGAWRVRVDNSNVETYGGLYTSTAYVPFMYDRDNTSYYIDPAGTSQTSTIYNNSWFRAQGNSGFYFQDWGGGWYMTDGTWIRSYNSKNVYVDQTLRADASILTGGGNGMFRQSSTGQFHQAAGFAFSADGSLIENGNSESGGIQVNGNNANIWSPGDADLVRFYDEDGMALRSYINSAGTYTVSDVRKKQNITPLSGALAKILSLHGYSYEYRLHQDEIAKGDKPVRTTGVIAQEVEKAMPELVDNHGEDGKFMKYDGLAPYFIEAIKEQQQQIEEVKSNISDFGSANVTSKELWIDYNADFSRSTAEGQVPTVTVTANQPNVTMYVAEKTRKGFKLVISSDVPQGLTVDYIAMSHAKKAAKPAEEKVDWNAVSNGDPFTTPAVKQSAEFQKMKEAEKAANDLLLIKHELKNRPELTGKDFEKEHAEKVRLAEEAKKKYTAVAEDAPAKEGKIADPNAPALQLPTAPK